MLFPVLLLLIAALASCSRREPAEMERVRAEALRGNPDAQLNLAMFYYQGMGLEPDYAKAVEWLQKAAAQNHPVAQFALGEMQLRGEGVVPDEEEAAQWIGKAAVQGYAPAQDELAVLYSDGTGVPQDDFQSVKWAGKAAEQGLPQAQHHLGFFLSCKMPSKVPRDPVTACMWFDLATSAGHEPSREFLATVQSELTPTQLAEVKKRVEQWKRTHQTGEWETAHE